MSRDTRDQRGGHRTNYPHSTRSGSTWGKTACNRRQRLRRKRADRAGGEFEGRTRNQFKWWWS